MHDLPCGARVIFGANGYIFLGPTMEKDQVLSYTENFEEVSVYHNLGVYCRISSELTNIHSYFVTRLA